MLWTDFKNALQRFLSCKQLFEILESFYIYVNTNFVISRTNLFVKIRQKHEIDLFCSRTEIINAPPIKYAAVQYFLKNKIRLLNNTCSVVFYQVTVVSFALSR